MYIVFNNIDNNTTNFVIISAHKVLLLLILFGQGSWIFTGSDQKSW